MKYQIFYNKIIEPGDKIDIYYNVNIDNSTQKINTHAICSYIKNNFTWRIFLISNYSFRFHI